MAEISLYATNFNRVADCSNSKMLSRRSKRDSNTEATYGSRRIGNRLLIGLDDAQIWGRLMGRGSELRLPVRREFS